MTRTGGGGADRGSRSSREGAGGSGSGNGSGATFSAAIVAGMAADGGESDSVNEKAGWAGKQNGQPRSPQWPSLNRWPGALECSCRPVSRRRRRRREQQQQLLARPWTSSDGVLRASTRGVCVGQCPQHRRRTAHRRRDALQGHCTRARGELVMATTRRGPTWVRRWC